MRVIADLWDQHEVSHSLPDVPENEGPTPVTSSWLGGAYLPPNKVATGPIPTTSDDLTAEEVARLSQVESLMSSSALPTVESAEPGERAEEPTVGANQHTPAVSEASLDSQVSSVSQVSIVSEAFSDSDVSLVSQVSEAAEPDIDEEIEEIDEAAEAAVYKAIRSSADDADADADAATVTGPDVDIPTSGLGAGAEMEVAAGDGAGLGSGDDDPGAVTTMFAVVTGKTLGDAETTTSFAAVDPVAPDRVAAPAEEVTENGTPPLRGQRSRTVLIALAGALVVVILGVAAAAAFGGERGKEPRSAPIPSAPAPVPSTPSGTAGPDKAFPRYSGRKSPVRGRIIDRAAGLSYSRLGGNWRYGQDGSGLSTVLRVSRKGPQGRGIMQAGAAEYLSAPLPVSLGRSATAAAARDVARDITRAGQLRGPSLLPYAVERLSGGLRGWLAGFQVQSGPDAGEIVAVAVVDTGAARRPGILCVTVPRADKSVRADIRALVQSLRAVR